MLSGRHTSFIGAFCIEACTYVNPNGIFPRVLWPSDGVFVVVLSWHPGVLKAGVICSLLTLRPTFALFLTALMCGLPGVLTHV